MGLTIIGPEQVQAAAVTTAPIVEIKEHWTDLWRFVPELQCLRASAKTASQGVGECELLHRYAPKVKQPYETDFAERKPADYRNYWVRITLSGGQGPAVVWTGRIAGEGREIYGAAAGPAGRQTWVAYEPLRLLERVPMATSLWLADGADPATDVKTLDWVPDMNGRGTWGMLVGNRSSATAGGTYVFGGTNRWTRAEFAAYVLERFMDEINDDAPGANDGPGWVLGGQSGLLRDIADIVKLDEGMSVADVLRALIHPRIGLDFVIVPMTFSGTNGGFEVQVYPIGAAGAGFGGKSMPRNNRLVAIQAATAKEMIRTTVSRSEDQRFGRIRVRGKRIVCAVTLRGVLAEGGGSLVPAWSAADEAAYIAAGGPGASGEEADLARTAEQFAGVYQDFAAPVNWDHQEGMAVGFLDPMGELLAAGNAQFQNQVRATLSFLPFREGYSYESGAEVKRAGVGNLTGFMAPQAWLFDEDVEGKRYVAADKSAITVSALSHEWGLRLQATPNHLLGSDHFPEDTATMTAPRYDHEKTVVTIAFETDRRIELVFSPLGDAWRPSDGELVIQDESADCWFAAPGTVFGMDAAGKLLSTPGELPLTLRNDIRQLYPWMAGAISRYIEPRSRAEIFLKGWQPWSLLLGAIMTVVDEAGESHQIQSPIVQVDYLLEDEAMTVIRAGFAR